VAKNGIKVYLDLEHEELLNEIATIKNLESVSTSGLIRFIVLDYYEMLSTKKPSETRDIKLSAMGKDISIILNLICALISNNKELGAPDSHVRNEDVLLYWQAQKYVESIIEKRKLGYGKRPKPPARIKEILEEKYVESASLEQFENERRDAEFEKLFGIDSYEGMDE